MLDEANGRLESGEDIIIGYIECHGRKETNYQIKNLEIIPRKQITYNGISLEEMDTEAIIKRNPESVLVDELAHNNVPGSKYNKRYKENIQRNKYFNIQHLESLNDSIKHITGIRVNETVPDLIIELADEVEVIDNCSHSYRIISCTHYYLYSHRS
ncbi:sensor protein KdpD [Gottschalkia purinilytica]|uniref:Sensor protein KdpD n=1 Tax=Gottschalkia purinilytica TaxID=1503 RepID=A0A0L0WBQ0_GOTPU|nr:hypothetical protein [Gottschalkia purinilytica]KNF08906.1 sensor protein KdpD [Gottschalkia purinilytica]